MKTYKIVTGDPSGDGHSIKETVFIKCNKTQQEINENYKKSCELTGLVFTENTPIIVEGEKLDWQHPEYNDRKIGVEYQSGGPSELAWKILKEHGIEETEVYDGETIVDLFMNFIKLSLSDLEFEIVPDKTETLHIGGIGYGLYD